MSPSLRVLAKHKDILTHIKQIPLAGIARKVCSKFGVNIKQMTRPESIDLLISMRQNILHPTPVKTIDRLILYDGPLGKVFGGQDPDLEFNPHVISVPKSVHLCSAVTHQAYTVQASVRHATYTTLFETKTEMKKKSDENTIIDIVVGNPLFKMEKNENCGLITRVNRSGKEIFISKTIMSEL